MAYQNVSTLIPNVFPKFLRNRLVKASGDKEAISKVVAVIKQDHPELFYSREEMSALGKMWAEERRERSERTAASDSDSALSGIMPLLMGE